MSGNLQKRRSGQAVMLVVVALGLVMIGAMGLAIDTGQLYGHRQMAQAAADAVAQAAVLSIYGGTNTGTNAFGGSSIHCANGSDLRSPCSYARLNGFGTTDSDDTIDIDFPTTVPGVTLSALFTPAAAHVVITRPVKTTLLRMLGASASTSVKAAATAAITDIVVAVPIIVTHPTLSGSFSLQGGGSNDTSILICGGPTQSIQINSSSLTSISVGGSSTVNLSQAGPDDTFGDCTSGTGGDFGAFGGPRLPNPPGWLTPVGSAENFYAPNPPVPDPYRNIPYPSDTGAPATPPTSVPVGIGSCPATLPDGSANPRPCTIYWPGTYPNGIGIQNQTAVFNPGVYYISGTGSGSFSGIGFGTGANGTMIMCSTDCTTDTTCCSSGGMLVYLTAAGGNIDIGSNSSAWLKGSDRSAVTTYKGLLFFGNRSLPAATGSRSHKLGGGGTLSLEGTIYLTNTTMTETQYQSVRMRGHAGSSTLIKGDIVVSTLDLGGGGSIRMQLDPLGVLTIPQVALVN